MPMAIGGDCPIPGTEAVIIDIGPTARSEDGTINLRKRRTVDEAGALEPTVKVRKKGNGASEKAVQVCGEWKYVYQQICFVHVYVRSI